MLEGIVGDTPCWSRSSYLKSESRQFRVTTITSHKQRGVDLKTAEEKKDHFKPSQCWTIRIQPQVHYSQTLYVTDMLNWHLLSLLPC